MRRGSSPIPGTSGGGDATPIMVTDAADAAGVLLFANGSVLISNGYALRRTRRGWVASDGNGGIGTYDAISRYAAALARKPPARTRVASLPPAACKIEP